MFPPPSTNSPCLLLFKEISEPREARIDLLLLAAAIVLIAIGAAYGTQPFTIILTKRYVGQSHHDVLCDIGRKLHGLVCDQMNLFLRVDTGNRLQSEALLKRELQRLPNVRQATRATDLQIDRQRSADLDDSAFMLGMKFDMHGPVSNDVRVTGENLIQRHVLLQMNRVPFQSQIL